MPSGTILRRGITPGIAAEYKYTTRSSDPKSFAHLADAVDAIPADADTIALDCTLSGDPESVIAILQNATPGGIVASTDAAMALMAEGHCSRIEPLGEMETTKGSVGVYAVWLKGGP